MNFLDAPSIFTVLSLTFSGSSNVFSAVFSPVRRTASYSRSTPQSKEISIGSVFPSMLTSLIKISSSVTVVTEDTAGKDGISTSRTIFRSIKSRTVFPSVSYPK